MSPYIYPIKVLPYLQLNIQHKLGYKNAPSLHPNLPNKNY